MPIRGSSEPIEIDSRTLPGKVTAAGPGEVNPKDFDLIGLAMQDAGAAVWIEWRT